MSLEDEINQMLAQMHTEEPQKKGSTGEKAVAKICEELYQSQGGILYHSYEYYVDPDLPGNIKNEDGKFYIENLGTVTEIDVLLVTPYRVFPIEVKAYKANTITLTDEGIDGCAITTKSPVHQNEMHCRHLYAKIFKALPNGSTEYIVPLVCFVDGAKIVDKRSKWQKDYIHVCILNTLEYTLAKYNTPLDYTINLGQMDKTLREYAAKWDSYYPLRT